MTSAQLEKLSLIKSACRSLLEESEKVTPGPLSYRREDGSSFCGMETWGDCFSVTGPKEYHAFALTKADAAFIAHARTLAPAACRALLTAIEGLEGFYNSSHLVVRQRYGILLTSILNEWPDL